jgi:hypothetical protein
MRQIHLLMYPEDTQLCERTRIEAEVIKPSEQKIFAPTIGWYLYNY